MKTQTATALLCLTLTGVSFPALAADYKCHVRAVDQGERIVLVDTGSPADARRAAGAAKVAAVKKGGTVAVAEVLECRLGSEPFSSARARALDEMTPR